MDNFARFSDLSSVVDLLTTTDSPVLSYRYNEFTGEVTTRDNEEISRYAVLKTTLELSRCFRWARTPPSKARVGDAIELAARENSYHPVRDYIQKCASDFPIDKDPTPEDSKLQRLFSRYMGSKHSDLRRAQSVAFGVAAVGRIFQPGLKFDTMPVLVGEQGLGKSTALLKLCCCDTWFHETKLDLKHKDALQGLSGVWLILIDEMGSIISESPAVTKQFLTATVDRYRPSYGEYFVRRPRQCVFVGTSNSLVLTDATGNRRYWPILCERRPDWNLIEKDRDSIWSEAYYYWRTYGATLTYLESKTLQDLIGCNVLERNARDEIKDFEAEDPWLPILAEFYNGEPFTIESLLQFIGVRDSSVKSYHVKRVARMLRREGFMSQRIRINKVRMRQWFRPT